MEESTNNHNNNNNDASETQPAAVQPVEAPVFHAPIVEVMCSFCRKLCFSHDELKTHERTHLENKKLVCRLCKKGFARRSYLSEHMLIHTGECPWKCTHPGCEKTFALRCNLVRHMRVHSGEKPFKCELCGKTFTLKKNMQEHRLTHTKEKPFNCPQCGRRFARRSSLVRHARTHTDSRTFECAHCGKKFPWRYYLQRHLQNKHDDPPKERVIRKRQRRTKAEIARDKAAKEAAKKGVEGPAPVVPIVPGHQIKIEEGEGEGSTTCVFVSNAVRGEEYEFEGMEPKAEETILMQVDDDDETPSTSKTPSDCSATREDEDSASEQETGNTFEPVEIKEEYIDVENVTDDEAQPLEPEAQMETNHIPVTALATSVIAYASSSSKVVGPSLVTTIVPRT